MAINKKLIHFKKREYFDREVANGNVPEHSICFIKDTKQIWTHGQLYNCNVDSLAANVQAVDTGDVLDDVSIDYATKTYVDGLVGDINSVLESIINGGGGLSLITFTIDGTEYQAEEGMTWEEWINGEYNPGIFAKNADGQTITCTSIAYSFIRLNNVNVLCTDYILSEGYTIYDPDI